MKACLGPARRDDDRIGIVVSVGHFLREYWRYNAANHGQCPVPHDGQAMGRRRQRQPHGTFIVTQSVLPDMIAAKWGRIVAIASSAAQTGELKMAYYAASIGGMISLAVEFGPSGITTNVVPPRFITGTIMSEQSFANSRQSRPAMRLPRLGRSRRAA